MGDDGVHCPRRHQGMQVCHRCVVQSDGLSDGPRQGGLQRQGIFPLDGFPFHLPYRAGYGRGFSPDHPGQGFTLDLRRLVRHLPRVVNGDPALFDSPGVLRGLRDFPQTSAWQRR